MDRGYQRGDTLVQREWVPTVLPASQGESLGTFTGRQITATITYVMSGYGVAAGYVVMQLTDIAVSAKHDRAE